MLPQNLDEIIIKLEHNPFSLRAETEYTDND